MANDVLLAGSSVLLAVRLAARYLAATEDRVTVLARPDGPAPDALRTAVEAAVRDLGKDPDVLAPDRLATPGFGGAGPLPRCSVVWLLTGDTGPAPLGDARFDAAVTRSLLASLPSSGVRAVNHVTAAEWPAVRTPAPGDHPERRTDVLVARRQADIERDVAAGCAASTVDHRLFRTVCPVATGVLPGAVPAGLHRLLAALDSVLTEVSARSGRYLRDEPLRCLVPPDAALRPMPMDAAARAMLDAARDPASAGGRHLLASSAPVPLADLLPRIGDVHGIRLVAADAPDRLAPADRLLHARLTGFGPDLPAPAGTGGGFAAVDVPVSPLTPPKQRTMLRSLRGDRRDHRRDEGTLVERRLTAASTDGGTAYRHGGPDAFPVVLLGAIGQGLRFWLPLLERLLETHRVLFLEPSGADEIEAVLAHAGVRRCHLVGWCTGPKAATAFALRRPDAVESLVFLNGSFKVAERDGDLDTPYERNLEILCRSVAARPGSARRLMRLFGGDGDDDETGTDVLARTHGDLRDDVRAPFRSEEALTAYATGMLAFWSDECAGAESVRAPVLAVGAQNDTVVSTARLRAAATRFPGARYVELLGATHQCLYDRAEPLVRLMREFWRDPGGELGLAAEIRTAAAGEETP